MSEVRVDSAAEELIVFREYSSVIEAEMVKSVLESAGIESRIGNEYMSAFYPVGVIYAQVIIRREDYERAEALITA